MLSVCVSSRVKKVLVLIRWLEEITQVTTALQNTLAAEAVAVILGQVPPLLSRRGAVLAVHVPRLTLVMDDQCIYNEAFLLTSDSHDVYHLCDLLGQESIYYRSVYSPCLPS